MNIISIQKDHNFMVTIEDTKLKIHALAQQAAELNISVDSYISIIQQKASFDKQATMYEVNK